MLNNIVKVSTFNSMATGIILPCNLKGDSTDSNHIIITPLHLLGSNKINRTEVKNNVNEYVDLEIFDSKHRPIDNHILDVFFSNSLLKEDDILAFLVKIEPGNISLNQKVSFENSFIRQKVETLGFPGILKEEINNKLILKGEMDIITIPDNPILSYRIMDDYHHYSDLKDHQILEGLSGAPVYSEDLTLIGMNQSIPFIHNEGNPFKNIYFITIRHILNFLRESGCILYEYEEKKIKIRWIKDQDKRSEELSLLIIGGSGAGKSSFITSFALHKEKINSSGDGQTTRTEVEYKLNRYEENPRANVIFLKENEFREKRKNDIWLDIISFMFVNVFNFKELDIYEDRLSYMKELSTKLRLVNEERINNGKIKIGEKILGITIPLVNSKGELDNKTLVEEYLKILEELSNISDVIKCPNIFNDDYLLNLEFEMIKRKEIGSISNDKEDFEDLYSRRLKEIMLDDPTENEKKEELISLIVKKIYDYPMGNIELNEIELKNQLMRILFEKKGFFSIEEFNFLFENTESGVLLKMEELAKLTLDTESINYCDIIHDICKGMKSLEDNFFETKLEKLLDSFFSCIYKVINENLNFSNRSGNTLTLEFNDWSKENQELLSKSLKTVSLQIKDKKHGLLTNRIDSLTAMIKKVIIYDSFSNDFALMFDDLDIKTLSLIDTHGLDHIEKGVSKKRLLKDFFSEQKENREKKLGKAKKAIDAVFYLKKLDSGRPTELDYIIPLIYDVEPQVTLYCIFTGIDIFNLNSKDINTSWKAGDITSPKAVQYLFSSDLEEALDKRLKFSTGKKKIIYHTLRGNIGAFCGTGNPKFHNINKQRIKKILISILIKEINSLDIISEELIDALNVGSKDYQKIKEEVKSLLLMFFDKASVTNWKSMRWNTVKANAQRVSGKKDNQLGYLGVYRHRWDMIFQDSYNEIFSDERYIKNVVDILGNHNEKVETALITSRENFLGRSQELAFRKSPKDPDSFKHILVSLYDDKERNPFKKKGSFGDNQLNESDYLNDVMNFRKLVTQNNNLDKFADLYIKKLQKTLQEERELSIQNILKYDESVYSGILSAFNEIKRIFEVDDFKAYSIFKDMANKVISLNK